MSATFVPARRLVTLEHAADYMSVCSRTVRRKVSDGELSGYRVGKRAIRVDLNEIDAKIQAMPTANTQEN